MQRMTLTHKLIKAFLQQHSKRLYSNISYILKLKGVIFMSIKSTIIIQQEENWYVATSVESGVTSQGKTIDEAINNLKEALELYYEDNVPEPQSSPIFITTLEVAV